MKNYHLAVISTQRPENVMRLQELIGKDCTWYVNAGEEEAYTKSGAAGVVGCAHNISAARNAALADARAHGLISIQTSDDLRQVKKITPTQKPFTITFEQTVQELLKAQAETGALYGGVALTSNPLNYTDQDITVDKLVTCDLIFFAPCEYIFSEELALKEDYDMTIALLTAGLPVARCNNILCEFPHRQNKGGANTYRNEITEGSATDKLFKKWPGIIKHHATRPGQVAIDYRAIEQKKQGQTFFDPFSA